MECGKLGMHIVILIAITKKIIQSAILKALKERWKSSGLHNPQERKKREAEKETGNKWQTQRPITYYYTLNVDSLNIPIKGEIGRANKKRSKIMQFTRNSVQHNDVVTLKGKDGKRYTIDIN